MKNPVRQPWLDMNGRFIPENQLEMLKNLYSLESWQSHLKSQAGLAMDSTLKGKLQSLIWNLPPQEREVLYWLFTMGTSVQSTARYMEITITSLITLKNRALTRLRMALEGMAVAA